MPHRDILDLHERVAPPLIGSLAIHVGVFGALLAYAVFQPKVTPFGDPNSFGGGAVGVSVVNQIPLPRRQAAVENKVANDSQTEAPVKPQEKKKTAAVKDDPDAIRLDLKKKKKTQTEIATRNQRYRPETAENQVYSTSGQAVSSPLFGVSGSGNLGTGTGSPFGGRFGWYEQILRRKVGERWRTSEVPMSIRTLPPAIVTFTITRDGRVGGVKILQSSGNYALDNSAQRAILEAGPFPELPPGFERSEARIEFWFELKR